MIAPRTLPLKPDEDIDVFGGKCEAHLSTHSPKPLYLEAHHVVPQGWQQLWTPLYDTPCPFAGKGTEGRKLWDARTVLLCRTSHGNVHFHIVWMMKKFASTAEPLTIPQLLSLCRADHHYHRGELAIAALALDRWQTMGGNLRLLTDLKAYGGIYG